MLELNKDEESYLEYFSLFLFSLKLTGFWNIIIAANKCIWHLYLKLGGEKNP